MSDTIYKFFANCIPVKGYSRSLICDLQRNRYHFIPNSLALLAADGLIDPALLLPGMDDEDRQRLQDYICFLERQELVFACSRELAAQFPPLSAEWDFPATISHALFDAMGGMPYFNSGLLDQLETLCCNYLQLRFYDAVSDEELQRIVHLVQDSQIKAMELLLPDLPGDQAFRKRISDLVATNRKIRSLTLHGADEDALLRQEQYGFGAILSVRERLSGATHCGVIHPAYFSVNIPTYTESLAYNTCLNRKIAIDAKGYIRNCPSMPKSFGHISGTSLLQAVKSDGFRDAWRISKDMIRKCRDCEFRHICTDCRAYTDDPADALAAPLKCGYDPYTCQWTEWSSNPLKQAAIAHYQLS